MRLKAVVVLTALLPGVASLAASDRMLCLHRNGEVRLEPIEPSCCRGETSDDASAPKCPDEGCQDLPVVEGSPISAHDASTVILDVCWTLLEPAAEELPLLPILSLDRPRSCSGPPPPGPERHLTSVILRR